MNANDLIVNFTHKDSINIIKTQKKKKKSFGFFKKFKNQP